MRNGLKLDFLSKKEIRLLLSTPERECGVCEWVITHCLFHTFDDKWYLTSENMEENDIEHIEQIFSRKLFQ